MFMHGAQSYYDMGVAMVDCVIVIVYTLACLGSFRTSATGLSREDNRDVQFALGI